MSRKLIALLALILAPAAMAQAPHHVDSLSVSGAEHVSQSRVLMELGFEAGDVFSPDKLADGLKRLHSTGRFAEIEVRAEQTGPGSLALHLRLVEHPRAASLRWEGLKKIKQSDLEEKISAAPGVFVSPFVLALDEVAILQHCAEEGYHGASLEQAMAGDDESVLVLTLTEGKKTKVSKVAFAGNSEVEEDQLLSALRLRPKSLWNPFSWRNSSVYQPDSVAMDIDRIVWLYHQQGYLDAYVLEAREEFNEEQDRVRITYLVEEGERYNLRDLSWDGNFNLPDSIIKWHLPLGAGDPFDGESLDRGVAAISGEYFDRGYLYNQVRPVRRQEDLAVDLHLEIVEGPLARVRNVVIEGNEKTRDKVIRREIRIYPGELFSREKLIRSHRDIFMLRFFDDVQFEPRTDPASGDVDLVFRVIERPLGNFGSGINYSEMTGIAGFIQFGTENLMGLGWKLNAMWEFGKRVQLFNFQYVNPWFRDKPTSLSISLYRTRSHLYREYYQDEKWGGSIGLSRPLPWLDHTRVGASYRLENIRLFDFSDSYLALGGNLAERDWPQLESSISLNLVRDSTDNPFLPGKGTRMRFSPRFAGGPLGGNLNYQKYSLKYTWYRKVAGPVVLRMSQELGFVNGLSAGDDVPDHELFRLGGNRFHPLRGYEDFSIVPEGNNPYLGGRSMTTGSLELVIGVSNSFQIVAPFFDFGGTWNSMAESDFSTLMRSVGIGARLEIPMLGVMGFDWGYPLDAGDTTKGKFHFKVGTDF